MLVPRRKSYVVQDPRSDPLKPPLTCSVPCTTLRGTHPRYPRGYSQMGWVTCQPTPYPTNRAGPGLIEAAGDRPGPSSWAADSQRYPLPYPPPATRCSPRIARSLVLHPGPTWQAAALAHQLPAKASGETPGALRTPEHPLRVSTDPTAAPGTSWGPFSPDLPGARAHRRPPQPRGSLRRTLQTVPAPP